MRIRLRESRRVGARSVAALVVAAAAFALSGPTQEAAPRATDLRVVISVADRRLWVLDTAGDTLLSASVAVGSGKTMTWRGRRWAFVTRPGEYRVLTKERDPVWVPPAWHFVEIARARRLAVVELRSDSRVALPDGRTLAVRRDSVGFVGADSVFRAIPPGRDIVHAGVLYIPPIGTVNRRVSGTLGKFRLNLGGGFGLHGTLEKESIGKAVTHGCIRLHDPDIEWLFQRIPVGARVTVF